MDFLIKNNKILELNKICRICLSEKGKMKSLFDSCLDSMIKSVTNIQINSGDGLPEIICFQCVLQVSRTFRFKKQCEKSDEILRNYINTTNHKTNIEKVEITQEIISVFENGNRANVLDKTNLNSSLNDTNLDSMKNDCPKNISDPEIEQDSFKCNNIEINNSSNYIDTKSNSIFNNKEGESIKLINYPCEICSKIFTKRKALLRHIKIHDNNKQYKCSECDKTFTEKSNLTKHMKKHTGELRKILGKPNLCTICGKLFKWKSSLSKHMHYHTKNKIYKCSYCPKFYVEKRTLDIHIRSHTGEKPFKCNICDKSFTQLCNLEKHSNIHANEKKFSCKICNKKFSQNGYVKIHMRSHTGEKPYQCQECGKCFSSSSNLIIHNNTCDIGRCKKKFVCLESVLIHKGTHTTSEKPLYQCTNCLKYFKSKKQLSQHKQSHLLSDELICEICNKNFASNYDLKNHSKMHCENIDKYSCVFCDKKLETIQERDTHQQEHTTILVFENNE